jgi:hypothetical protein
MNQHRLVNAGEQSVLNYLQEQEFPYLSPRTNRCASHSMLDLKWTKWHCARVFTDFSTFPVNIIQKWHDTHILVSSEG